MPNSKETFPPSEVDFGKLELLFGEPTCTRVFEQIKLWNGANCNKLLTFQEVSEVVASIDSQWKDYLHKAVSISGTVSFSSLHNPEGLDTSRYNDEPMIFLGAAPYPVAPDQAEYDSRVTVEDAAHYQLRIMLRRPVTLDDGRVVSEQGLASIENLADLHFTEYMSIERARGVLENYCPETLESLNNLASFAQDEAEIIFGDGISGLAQLEVKTDSFDPATLDTVRRSLDTYSNHILKFDTKAPYVISVSGYMWIKHDAENAVLENREYQGLASLDETEWERVSDPEGTWLVPCIKTVFLLNHHSQDTPAVVPASGFAGLRSIRDTFDVDE